ncbi:MAG: DUF1850 domain-containing protein [Peptococcaceae bacterium]|nr:DUF1850 domain-containing protein [Peptococcaceae bacterium]
MRWALRFNAHSFMNKVKYLAVLLAIIFVIPIRVLIIAEAGKSFGPVYILCVPAGETVIIKYVHSVERTPWHHYYVVTANNKLKLVAMRFQSFGAGVPDYAPTARIIDGWIEYAGYDQEFSNLLWNVQSSLEHRFEMHGKDIYFGDLVSDQGNALIRVAYRPIFYYLLTQNQFRRLRR